MSWWLCRFDASRGQVTAASSDYVSSSFHSDADSSVFSGSELSDAAALTELMVGIHTFE